MCDGDLYSDFYKEYDDQFGVELRRKRQSWEQYWACEQSIASARASVMVYDDVNKKWVPSGSSSGLSKVHIYQHTVQQTFRVVGRKLQDHEVVINCAILKGLKYNQATATFHQWRDNKQVYGLNFSSKEDADLFARAMFHSLEILSNIVRPPQQQYSPAQPPQPQIYDEDMGYRTMTREDVAMIQERRISTSLMSPQQTSPMNNVPQAPALPNNISVQPSPISPPSNSGNDQRGHQRTTSAPPAPPPMSGPPPPMGGPPPPPMGPSMAPPVPPMGPPPMNGMAMAMNGGGPPAPMMMTPTPMMMTPTPMMMTPTPMMMTTPTTMANAGGPPPPPPPPMNMTRSASSDMVENSLAAQLQNARLKKSQKNTQPPPAENSGSSTSSGGSSNYGTIGRGGGGSMASMMDEMAKTLARRRAAVEKKVPIADDDDKKATWEKTNTLPANSGKHSHNGDSPKSVRKRFGSASEETILKVNGLTDGLSLAPTDLESLKNELVKEIQKEITKMKQEILDAIKSELNRR